MFEVGDRVRRITVENGVVPVGALGTIAGRVLGDENMYFVDWDMGSSLEARKSFAFRLQLVEKKKMTLNSLQGIVGLDLFPVLRQGWAGGPVETVATTMTMEELVDLNHTLTNQLKQRDEQLAEAQRFKVDFEKRGLVDRKLLQDLGDKLKEVTGVRGSEFDDWIRRAIKHLGQPNLTVTNQDPYHATCQSCANLKEINHDQYQEHMRLLGELQWHQRELARYNPKLVKAHEDSIRREMAEKKR